MKNIIKKIILHPIRYILTILKNNCLPLPYTPYNQIRYKQEQLEKSYNTFKEHYGKSTLFSVVDNPTASHKYIINKAKEIDKDNNKFYLEFGVFKGTSINHFSKFVKKIYGFDSFEGLREDWNGRINHPKTTFTLNKKLPKLNSNVVPIVGWVQDTLVPFLKEHNPSIVFSHMDLDTYESTKFVLEKIKPYLSKKSIILFDELYNYVGWEYGEYKALKEVFKDSEYDFILFAIDAPHAAIQLK